MGEPRFVSARLKVDRAVSHINQLQAVLGAFLKTDFYRLWMDADAQTGMYHVRYETKPLPAEVPMIIGDAIHNLHVPLDHIANEITRSTGRNSDRIQFPKHKTRDSVAKSKDLALIVEAAPQLEAIILDEICPYEGGRFALWELGKLDNVDKHKLLVPTVAISQLSGISAIDDNGNAFLDAKVTVGAGGSFHIGSFGVPARITNYGKPTFNVKFAEGSYFTGDSVVPTLIQLAQFVHSVILILERAYFGARTA